MKSSTGIHGVVEAWRLGKSFDSYRIAVSVPTHQWISSKVHPTLRQLNSYLEARALHREQALRDQEFLSLRQRMIHELKSEHGLKEYRTRVRVDLITKAFNFEQSIEEFVLFKSDTSVPMKHKAILKNIWLPFFLAQGCKHPREFIEWRTQAQKHIRTLKKMEKDELYSVHTRISFTNAINEYMRWLLEEDGSITEDEMFNLHARITLEQKKQGLSSRSRKRDTYTESDLLEIKRLIDLHYKNDPKWKLRAYGIYFGVCTGIRRGNLLGLTAECLRPDEDVPYFVTHDNIVDGWSRGKKGAVTLEVSTKTFVGSVTLPLIQPSVSVLVEVSRYLKLNLGRNDRLVHCYPRTVEKWWKKIANDCQFGFLGPHEWKHSYATVGARRLQEWYGGNPYKLHECCMHEKFETTLRYVNQKGEEFLKSFSKPKLEG